MKKIKGLIFDLDGVITDTAVLHYEAWRKTLEKENISYTKNENESLKGLSRRDTLLAILNLKKIKMSDQQINKICKDKNDFYVSLLKTKLNEKDILPGVLKLLKEAKNNKLKLAIASSSKNASLILERLKIKNYFDYIVNVNGIKNGKPAPDIYLDAAKGLNLLVQECIGFEDANAGIKGLLAANINTVSITNKNIDMYVKNTYICETTKDLDLNKIINYFSSSEPLSCESLYHKAYGRFAYQNKTGDTLSVILRTKKDNVLNVKVRLGDPFNWRKKDGSDEGVTQFGGDQSMYWVEEEPFMMEKYLCDDYFDYYKAKIKTKTKRIRYAFEITGLDHSKILYGERGFFAQDFPISEIGFTWGYLNIGNVFNVPNWVSKTVWYQIFPERFWNGDPSNDNKGTLKWNSAEPSRENYFGGDLQGVIDKLKHLKDLGVSGIYFTPIFKANTNHKYDTEDYLKIDPHFGDEKIFKTLVEQCHKNGIKVMIDAVFNHSGSKFGPWLDVIKNKEKSKYKDWFWVNDFKDLKSADEYPSNYLQNKNYVYETFAFTPHMPRLNWNNQEVINYFKTVVQKWTKLGIDAWRLDVANEPPLNFWRMFRKWAKDINPDIYILGEVWYDSSLYLNGDTFDGVMNYTLRDCIIKSITNNLSPVDIKKELSKYLLLYNNTIKRGMFNLLSSHDTPRLLTIFNDDVKKFMIAYRILFHMLGSVCIYYGDEIGMNGEHDPGCRKCMVWDKKQWNFDILTMFKKLIKMRKNYNQLTIGEFKFLDENLTRKLFDKKIDENNLFLFSLYENNKELYCIINLSNKDIKLSLNKTKKWFDAYNEKKLTNNCLLQSYDMLTLEEIKK